MRLLFLIALLLPIAAPHVAAQSRSAAGAIEGVVLDPAGGAVPGVRVVAARDQSAYVRKTETDAAGHFRFAALPIGEYTLRLDKSGFAPVQVKEFTVSIGQTVVERIAMKLPNVTQSIDVIDEPDALQSAAVTANTALGGERIEESPANNRNYLSFVLIAPGVATSASSNTQRTATAVRNASADSGFTFAGMRPRNNALSIDGVDNRDETTGAIRVSIGLEEVQEFQVSGTAVSAEFGGAAGGSVNVVTRSGTNLWHGDATFFAQNEIADARNPEILSAARPRFRRWQPGTSLNGPIRRDRTFFALAFEQEWESSDEWSEVPAEAEAVLNRALESPMFSRSPVRSVQEGLVREDSSQTTFSFKLNHQIGSAHALTARWAFSRGRLDHDATDGNNFIDRSARGNSLTTDNSLVGGWTDVISPHVVNDVRFQWARRDLSITPAMHGATLEIPGVLTMGQGVGLDQQRTEDHTQVVETMSITDGSHFVSLGADAQLIHLDARLGDRFGGLYIFPTVAEFAEGRPDVFLQAFGDPRTRMRTTPVGLWVNDRWRVANGLAIEAGLRYDKQFLPAEIPTANRNLAPRLGLVWRPAGKARWVLRAGFGLFYDRYPLAYLNNAIQKDGIHGFEQYAAGGAAVDAFALGLGGALTAPLPGVARSSYVASRSFPPAYSRKLTAGMERAFGRSTTATAELSWVEGYHLPRIRNIAGGIPPAWELDQTARSSYQGASLSINRRLTNELSYLFGYTIGRTRDDSSDFDEQPLDPLNTRLDWARSRQHQLQRFTASAVFELPAEEMGSAPPRLKDALEHVVVAPIVTFGSGRPLNALETTDLYRTGAYPISARPLGMPRNPFYTPPIFSTDLRVMKGFPIRNNRAILQTGLEAFNLTNHTNAVRVSPYFAAGAVRLSSYGTPIETQNARQVQFMIQLEY